MNVGLQSWASSNSARGCQMGGWKLHWGRIITAGLLSEIALFIAIVPLGLRLGDAFLRYAAPPASFLACFLGALWASRRIPSRLVLHGLLIGLVATLFYLAISRF